MKNNEKISVVVPVYGCPKALPELYKRVVDVFIDLNVDYEIILVNDGCPDGSWLEIEKICSKDENVMGIDLLRNFGQIHATNAGVDYATGDYIVVMDCDLQDKPEAIKDLYNKMLEGNDVVFVKRKNRKDNVFAITMSKLFYKIYNHYVSGYYDSDICNFCIVSKKVVDEYKKINDNNKSFTTTICWLNYKTDYIVYESEKRYEGKSSYTLGKKIDLAIDMLTSQSNKPLKTLIKFGVIVSIVGFIYLISQIVLYFIQGNINEGWTSIIASIMLFGGFVLISVGAVGIYVGNIFVQTKNLPGYIIKEIKNEKR